MNTSTYTYTRTDVRKVFENFQADLMMLATRTQAMSSKDECDHAHDVLVMAQEDCLKKVHIQLLDQFGNFIRVHVYDVKKNISWDSNRPGENKWPCLPSGKLRVIVSYSDPVKAEQLKQSEKLILNWGPSSASTDYSSMKNDGEKLYASNNYGVRRNTFTA